MNRDSKTQAGLFDRIAKWCARLFGTAGAFGVALSVIILWAVTGPLFGFSDTWQLVINTGTTIVTFLMVFLIQNTQNRDGTALQLKLDEIIRSIKTARNSMLDLEKLSQHDLEKLQTMYTNMANTEKRSATDTGRAPGKQVSRAKERLLSHKRPS